MKKGKVVLYRGQIGVSKGLDITVKSASGSRSKMLAPSWKMVLGVQSGNLSKDEYTVEYRKQLEALGVDFWVALGEYARSKGSAITFLCYCADIKDGKPVFCHTRLVIKWLTDHDVYSKWFASGLED